MPLYTNPAHRMSLYSSEPSRDAGGGTTLTFTLAQSAIPCSINTASAQEQELFAQLSLQVSHVIGVLSEYLTVPVARGMKVVADDTGDSYHVTGIRAGRASPNGSIPALTYIQCQQQI